MIKFLRILISQNWVKFNIKINRKYKLKNFFLKLMMQKVIFKIKFMNQ